MGVVSLLESLENANERFRARVEEMEKVRVEEIEKHLRTLKDALQTDATLSADHVPPEEKGAHTLKDAMPTNAIPWDIPEAGLAYAMLSADHAPPKFAEFLLTALDATRTTEAMIGDLNERFADNCEELGRRHAVRLYWLRTLGSLWPLLRRAIDKALKWGAVVAAVKRMF